MCAAALRRARHRAAAGAVREETFTTKDPPRLQVQLPAGEVEVTTGDGAETTVVLEPLNERARTAIEKAELRASRGHVVVKVGVRRAGRVGVTPRTRVRVIAPHGSSLDVRSAAADVVARGRYGHVGLHTADGAVGIAEVDGSLTLHGVSGGVTVQRVGGDVTANTVTGDVRIGELAGDLRWNTVSGDIEVLSIAGTRVDAHSVSGDIKLGVRRGASVFLDITTIAGKGVSELDDTGDVPPPGPFMTVRAHSVSGDVRIGRA
jgi:hypothetical protein